MKERLFIALVVVAGAIYLMFGTTRAVLTPPIINERQKISEQSPSREFVSSDGHKVRITTPVLDRFLYAGDAVFCVELREASKWNPDSARELSQECDGLAMGTPQEIIQRRIRLAALIGDGEYTYSLRSNEAERDKRIALAISALRASLDAAAPHSPAEAFAALEKLWIAGDVSDSFAYYQPAYLFGAALRVEAGEAMLALCPLAGRDDCDVFVPGGMANALRDLGRWKSDESMLLRSAELLQREYRAIKNPGKEMELEFAQAYSAVLGYANEINPGQNSVHARRGIAPLEEWLTRYEDDTDERALQYIYDDIGEAYGRIAENTREKADAKKAIKFNTLTFNIATKFNKDGPDWRTMANLGEDILILAELTQQEPEFQRALELHRNAYSITQTLNSRESSAYMNMKLARTLQRYAKAELPATADALKIAMLEEAIKLAQALKPLFERTGTTTYLNITNRILVEANDQLEKLKHKTLSSVSHRTR